MAATRNTWLNVLSMACLGGGYAIWHFQWVPGDWLPVPTGTVQTTDSAATPRFPAEVTTTPENLPAEGELASAADRQSPPSSDKPAAEPDATAWAAAWTRFAPAAPNATGNSVTGTPASVPSAVPHVNGPAPQPAASPLDDVPPWAVAATMATAPTGVSQLLHEQAQEPMPMPANLQAAPVPLSVSGNNQSDAAPWASAAVLPKTPVAPPASRSESVAEQRTANGSAVGNPLRPADTNLTRVPATAPLLLPADIASSSPLPAAGEVQFASASLSQSTSTSADRFMLKPANTAQPVMSEPQLLAVPSEADSASNIVARHRELSMRYWREPSQRAGLIDELQSLARIIYFNGHPYCVAPYVVQPGESLSIIAAMHGLSWEYVARLNQIAPSATRAGQKLKLIPGPFAAVVDLSDREITVHAHGYYVCHFPIAWSGTAATLRGKLTVLGKERNPEFVSLARTVDREDPANPLGEHWINLGEGMIIHGTPTQSSAIAPPAEGIRLRSHDIDLLFDLLVEGSDVVIRD